MTPKHLVALWKHVKTYMVLLSIACGFPGCMVTGIEFGGEFLFTTTDGQNRITISASAVTGSSVRLSITSTFNASDAAVFRNGQIYAHVNLSDRQATEFVDANVVAGNVYTYQTGGLFFAEGEVWSNTVTVAIP